MELRLRQTTYWDVTTSCGRAAPWDTEQMKGLLLQITQDSDGQPRPTVSPVNGSMVIFETDQGRNFVRVVSPAVPNDEAGGEGAASPTTGSRMLSCLPAFSSCLPSPPACVPRCVPAVAAKLSTALIYDLFAVLKKDSTTPQTFYEAPPSARAARCNLDLGQISASRSA